MPCARAQTPVLRGSRVGPWGIDLHCVRVPNAVGCRDSLQQCAFECGWLGMGTGGKFVGAMSARIPRGDLPARLAKCCVMALGGGGFAVRARTQGEGGGGGGGSSGQLGFSQGEGGFKPERVHWGWRRDQK